MTTTPTVAQRAVRRRAPVAAWTVVVACTTAVVVFATIRGLASGYEPVGDNALIELRARDVFTDHWPLLGTWSSASVAAGQDLNHPGPLLFDLFAVPVRLLGGRAGIAVGAAALNIAAVWGSVLVARRVGWRRRRPRHGARRGRPGVDDGQRAAVRRLAAEHPRAAVLRLPRARLGGLRRARGSAAVGRRRRLAVRAGAPQLPVRRPGRSSAPASSPCGGTPRAALWRRHGRSLLLALAVGLLAWAQPLLEQLFGAGRGNISPAGSSGSDDGVRSGLSLAVRMVAAVLAIPPAWFRPGYDTAIPLTPWTETADGRVLDPALPAVGVAARRPPRPGRRRRGHRWWTRRHGDPTHGTRGGRVPRHRGRRACSRRRSPRSTSSGCRPTRCAGCGRGRLRRGLLCGGCRACRRGPLERARPRRRPDRRRGDRRRRVAADPADVRARRRPCRATVVVARRGRPPRPDRTPSRTPASVLFDPEAPALRRAVLSAPLMAELGRRGVPFLVGTSGLARQVGADRAFRGTADVRLFFQLGDDGRPWRRRGPGSSGPSRPTCTARSPCSSSPTTARSGPSMDDRPSVDVVVPVYNEEHVLADERGAAARLPGARSSRSPGASSSPTTGRPTARWPSPSGSRRATDGVDVLAIDGKGRGAGAPGGVDGLERRRRRVHRRRPVDRTDRAAAARRPAGVRALRPGRSDHG